MPETSGSSLAVDMLGVGLAPDADGNLTLSSPACSRRSPFGAADHPATRPHSADAEHRGSGAGCRPTSSGNSPGGYDRDEVRHAGAPAAGLIRVTDRPDGRLRVLRGRRSDVGRGDGERILILPTSARAFTAPSLVARVIRSTTSPMIRWRSSACCCGVDACGSAFVRARRRGVVVRMVRSVTRFVNVPNPRRPLAVRSHEIVPRGSSLWTSYVTTAPGASKVWVVACRWRSSPRSCWVPEWDSSMSPTDGSRQRTHRSP